MAQRRRQLRQAFARLFAKLPRRLFWVRLHPLLSRPGLNSIVCVKDNFCRGTEAPLFRKKRVLEFGQWPPRPCGRFRHSRLGRFAGGHQFEKLAEKIPDRHNARAEHFQQQMPAPRQPPARNQHRAPNHSHSQQRINVAGRVHWHGTWCRTGGAFTGLRCSGGGFLPRTGIAVGTLLAF